jgi:cell division protease FtsH
MNKYVRSLLVWLVTLAIVVYLILPLFRHAAAPVEEIAYSDFLDRARAGQVTQVTISDQTVSGVLKNGRAFQSTVPANDTSYVALLQAKGVTITVVPRSRSSFWPNLLVTMLPFILLIGLWMLMLRQAQSAGDVVR